MSGAADKAQHVKDSVAIVVEREVEICCEIQAVMTRHDEALMQAFSPMAEARTPEELRHYVMRAWGGILLECLSDMIRQNLKPGTSGRDANNVFKQIVAEAVCDAFHANQYGDGEARH